MCVIYCKRFTKRTSSNLRLEGNKGGNTPGLTSQVRCVYELNVQHL